MIFKSSFMDIELSPYKWVCHLEKLKTLAEEGDVFPVTVELDLVDYCNHGCWWCVDPIHKQNFLEREFLSRLLVELKSLEIQGIVFKGSGEPMLHEHFSEVISETKGLGFELGIVTNGSMLIELYEDVVKNAGYLRVSIDAPDEKKHRKLHRSDDFKYIIDGISKVVKFKKVKQQRHPIIGISYAMDYSMIELVGEAIKLGDSLKVDYILLRPPFFEEVGRKSSMTTHEKKQLITTFEMEKEAYKGPMKVFIDYWVSDADSKEILSVKDSPRRGGYIQQGANGIEHITGRCLASPLLAVVAADKKVYPCCNLRLLEDWSIGTLDYEYGKNFRMLWSSAKRKEIIDKIHRIECIKYCTHPMSRYNEIIEYLNSPQYHKGFV